MARGKKSRPRPSNTEAADSEDDIQTLKRSGKAFQRDETFQDSEDECMIYEVSNADI
jgi:hypothetical protein